MHSFGFTLMLLLLCFSQVVWLELAAFQSVGIDSGIASTARLRRRDAAVLDKQVAIFERGLESCPSSLRLTRSLLRAIQELKPKEEVCVLGETVACVNVACS
jgi:hypothetical protein